MTQDPFQYFRVEAKELLDGLSQGVLSLEKGRAEQETVTQLLRQAHTLKGASRVVKQLEIAESAHAIEDVLSPFRQSTMVPKDSIDQLLKLLDAIADKVKLLGVEKKTAALPKESEDIFESVRVGILELDKILESATEANTQLLGVRNQVKRLGNDDQREILQRVDMCSKEIEQINEEIKQLRFVQVGILEATLERAVRDAATVLNKEVTFTMHGKQTRLEAHVLIAIRDALLHVVRNAVAHGIESDRKNKKREGTVVLSVERKGDTVRFTCEDDGAGIDFKAVRQKFPNQELSDEDVIAKILAGGTSTSKTLSEVAGRGVGLSVLNETIKRLKGDLKVHSTLGVKTIVEFTVPVSTSFLKVLQVEINGQTVCLPLDGISKTCRLKQEEMIETPQGLSIVVDEKSIPFTPLIRFLNRDSDKKLWTALVIGNNGKQIALGVDKILGVEQTVIKRLPKEINTDLFMGAALDGEGNPLLVFNPRALVGNAHTQKAVKLQTETTKIDPILIVDDSLTTRMLEQSILEAAGYDVDMATSAEEALEKLKDHHYSLFVVDVEMPGMNGFEFVSYVHNDSIWHNTPCILVTSCNTHEDKRRGEQAGAKAYLVKSEFEQQELLKTIHRLVHA